MVHKKYTVRNGKVYGPYLYHNERVDGKVVTTYLGSHKDKQRDFLLKFLSAGLVLVIISMFFMMYLMVFKIVSPTGRAITDINTTYMPGDKISGNLNIQLKAGELIPRNTLVSFIVNNQTRTFNLDELISNSPTSGDYYIEDSGISGSGDGYGIPGKKQLYKDVSFDFIVIKESKTGEEASTQPVEPSQGEAASPEQDNSQQLNPETQPESADSSTTNNPDNSGLGSGTEASPGDSSSGEKSSGSLGITGNAIMTQSSSSTTIRKDSPYTYTLGEGESVAIVEGSVMSEEKSLDSSVVNVRIDDGKAVFSTDYSEEEQGFGKDYISPETYSIDIDVKQANLLAETGTLYSVVSYNDEVLLNISTSIKVITSYQNETNASAILTLEKIKDIPDLTIGRNGNFTINLLDYFSGASSYEFLGEGINYSFEGDSLIVYSGNASGSVKAKIIAHAGSVKIESNEFLINTLNTSITKQISRSRIRLGEPVRWAENISLDSTQQIELELPKEAKNISVKQIIKESNAPETAKKKTGEIGTQAISASDVPESSLKKTYTENNLILTLSEQATDYSVEYYTDGPVSFEENTSNGKKVVISAPDALKYTDVEAYTDVPESIPVQSNNTIKILWVEDNSYINFSALDRNNNSLIDYLEWVVPHLSNQTFIISLNGTITQNITFESPSQNISHLGIDNSASPYSGLVSYWSFDADSSTTAYDIAGTNDGAYQGNTLSNSSSGLYGKGAYFDGANDYIDAGTAASLDLGTNFTVSAWVKPSVLINYAGIVSKVISDRSGVYSYMLVCHNDGTIGLYNGTTWFFSNNAGIAANNWYHLTWVWNGTNLSYYVNGQSYGSSKTGYADNAAHDVFFGSWYSVSTAYDFNGAMDDIMIFNKSLTATEVNNVYKNQSARFKSQGIITAAQRPISAGNNTVNLTLLNYSANLGSYSQGRVGAWDVSQGYNETDLNTTANGLVSYWHLDEASWAGTSGEVKDAMGRNNGTGIGGINTTASGMYYRGGSFDGSAGYINVSNFPTIGQNDNYTVSVWANSNNGGVLRAVIDKTSSKYPFQFWMGNGDISLWVYDGTNNPHASYATTVASSTWYHIVGIRDKSLGKLFLYVNGVKVAEGTDTTTTTIDTTSPLQFGRRNNAGGDYYFNGNLDEIMIFNRSLSDSEVKELYVKGRAKWNYTSWINFTSSGVSGAHAVTPATTNILPEAKLYSDSYKFYTPYLSGIMTSSDRHAAPIVNSVVLNSTKPSTNDTNQNLTAYASDSNADGDNITLVYNWYNIAPLGIAQDSSVIGYWPLDNDANDYLSKINGTVYTATLSKTDFKTGTGSYYFNDNGYIDLPNSNIFDTQRLTICSWIKPLEFINGFIFEKGPVNTQYSFFFESGDIVFRSYNNVGAINDLRGVATSNGFTANQWAFTCAVYDGSYKRIFVDGVEKLNVSYVQTLATGQSGERIGAYGGGAPGYYFYGNIDGVIVYNRSLTAGEIVQLNNSNPFAQKTTLITSGLVSYYPLNNDTLDYWGSNDGTNNGASLTGSGKVGGAYQFDGVNDYINITNNILSPTMTVSMWVNSNKIEQNAFYLNNLGVSTNRFYFYSYAEDIGIGWRFDNAGANRLFTIPRTTAGFTQNNTWYNLIAVIDPLGGEHRLYVNGVSKSNTSSTYSIGTILAPSQIGNIVSGSEFFNGSIDELMIFNRSLSASEVKMLYDGSKYGGNVLGAEYTEAGESWKAGVTPYDYASVGLEVNSNNISIDKVCPGWMDGDGNITSPCVVTNCTQLQNISNRLNLSYALANNINCSNTSSWNSGAGFLPIGTDTAPFNGDFNGKGYIISDLFINRSGTIYVGLFGYTGSGANITNTNLTGLKVSAFELTGGLVGLNSGTLKNDNVKGNVTANGGSMSQQVGGLVGKNNGGTIYGCSMVGNVYGDISSTSDTYLGGLVGYDVNGIINRSYMIGQVKSYGDRVGGLVGSTSGTSNVDLITDSYANITAMTGINYVGGLVGYNNYGTIARCYAVGSFTSYGTSDMGGLVGNNVQATITDCYARMTISSGSSTYVGGLVGYNGGGTVSNCYATGDISTSGDRVGGLVGINALSGLVGKVKNSYATGEVYKTGGTGTYFGGLIGENGTMGVITNGYWYELSISQCYYGGNANCTKAPNRSVFYDVKNTYAVYTGGSPAWNFTNVWDDIYDDTNYPILRWQGVLGAPTIDSIILNSTEPRTNDTNQNLTVYTTFSSLRRYNITLAYNWYNNNVLNATTLITSKDANGNGLVSYYPLNNDTLDYYGSNDGVNNGSVQNSSGKISGAYQFNGKNNSISAPQLLYNENATFGGWFNAAYLSATPSVYTVLMQQADASDIGFEMYTAGTNLACWDGSKATSLYPITAGRWYHAVCRYNSTNITLYVNGTAVAFGARSVNVPANQNFVIGAGIPQNNYYFNGTIDEVQVWNRSLTDLEIKQLYEGSRLGGNILGNNNLIAGDIWKVGVVGYDYLNPGDETFSNNIGINFTLNITSYNYTNFTGSTGGTVIRGQNITINATVVGVVSNVWVVIWQNIIGGPMVLIQNLVNYLGNLWSAVIQTNSSFPTGIVNYTIYANASTNANVSMNGTITILSNWPNITTNTLTTTNPFTNDTLQNLSATVSANSPYGYNVTLIYNWYKNNVLNATTLITSKDANGNGLVSYYPLNNDTLDYWGDNNGTINGNPVNNNTNGKVGNGYYFDGNDYLSLPSTSFNFGTGNLSILVWFKTTQTAVNMILNFRQSDNEPHIEMYTNYPSVGNLGVHILPGNVWTRPTHTSSSINDGNWHFAALSLGQSAEPYYNLYVDGNLSAQSNYTGTLSNWDTIYIGRDLAGTQYLTGSLDELMIFNRSLSALEIKQIYEGSRLGGNKLSANLTEIGDVWKLGVLGYDYIGNGSEVFSNNVTILNGLPNVTSVALTSTNASTNDTLQNMTITSISASDADNHNITFAYNWYKNNVLNATSLITNGLAAYWPLNNDTLDYWGNADMMNNGTVQSFGKVGGAYRFEGVNNYTGAAITPHPGEFTLSFWVNSSQNDRVIMGFTEQPWPGYNFDRGFAIDSSNKMRWKIYNGATRVAVSTTSITPGVWYHVVGVINTTSGNSIYINGIKENTNAAGTNGWNSYSTPYLVLGGGNNADWPITIGSNIFNGTLDEVMVFNRTLTDLEIKQLYEGSRLGGSVLSDNLTSAGDIWKVGVTGFDYLGNGSQSLSNSITITNTAPNITSVGLSTTNPSTNDTLQNLTVTSISASDADNHNITFAYNWYKNNTLNATTLITNGLVGYWPLNNDTFDYWGSNDGVNNGATLNTSGKVGGAYHFNGAGDNVRLGQNILDYSVASGVTLELWVKPGDAANLGSSNIRLIEQAWHDPIIFLYSGQYAFGLTSDGTWTSCYALGSSNPSVGVWDHVVGVWNGTAALVYVNGNLSGIDTTSCSNRAGTGGYLDLGHYTGGGLDFNGTLDEVKVYNRSLSASEVKMLYEGSRLGGNVLSDSLTTRADIWKTGVVPFDYLGNGSEVFSNNVTILNGLPNITSVGLTSTEPRTNDTNQNLSASIFATDADTDNITFAYNWYKNNNLNATSLITNGLAAYWPLNNDTLDYFGANDGTPLNGALLNTSGGRVGGAYQFDGEDDRITGITSVNLNSSKGFTVSVWTKPNNFTNDYNYCSNGIITSTDGNVYLNGGWSISECIYGTLGRAVFWLSNASSTTQLVLSPTKSIWDNGWHQLTATVLTSGNVVFYIDGVNESQVSAAPYGEVITNNVLISTNQLGGTAKYFNGTIDEVMIFNRSLSALEVKQLYEGSRLGGSQLHSSNLIAGDIWKVGVYGLDYLGNGSETLSNNIGINFTLNITTYNYTNVTGTTAGTVTRGQNITINATVVGVVSNVWVVIWQNVIGGPVVLIQNLINYLGNLWSAVIQTNYTFPSGLVNYTIYANVSANINVSMNGTINITQNIAYLSDCGVLNESNTIYTLQRSITGIAGTCFNITANNITLDGAGYSLNGTSSSMAVWVSGYNNSLIKNLRINDFTTSSSSGIYFYTSINSSAINNTLYNAYNGILSYPYSDNNRMIGNNIANCYNGLYSGYSNTVLIANNTGLNNAYSIYVYGSNNNIILNNSMLNSTSRGVYIAASSNNTRVLQNFLTGGSFSISIQSASINTTIDRNTVQGASTRALFTFASSTNNTITNNYFSSNPNAIGVYLGGGCSYNWIINNTVNSNSYGFDINSNYNTLTNNTVYNNTNGGLMLESTSNNSIIVNLNSSANGQYTPWVYTFVPGMVNSFSYSASAGEIMWTNSSFLQNLTVAGNLTFPGNIVIADNYVYFNSSAFAGQLINSSANVTLNNIGKRGYPYPKIRKDGILCTDCYNFTSLTATTVIFNVTSWSNYTIGSGMNGSGTVGDPYVITNCTQLQAMQDNMTLSYALANNVDCTESIGWNGGAGFVAVGVSDGSATIPGCFKGNFDGRNFTITNLYESRTAYPAGENQGLFGCLNTSSNVSNVGLINVSVSAYGDSGGLVGANFGNIFNSFVTGRVTGNVYSMGGLVGLYGGYGPATGSITNCYVNVSVSGSAIYVGALVGLAYQNITNCYATGKVSNSGGDLGGFVGVAGGNTYTNCFSDVEVAGGTTYRTGGFIGRNYANIVNCFWNNRTLSTVKLAIGEQDAGTINLTAIQNDSSYFYWRNNPPMESWDFTGTWSKIEGANPTYPLLKGFNASIGMLGDGSSGNPFNITSCSQLQDMNLNLSSNYSLNNSINCSYTKLWNSGAGFKPVGNQTTGAEFKGNFNGNYNTVSNLTINRPSISYVGLFGYTTKNISNINLINVNVTGSSFTAGLIGNQYSGTISNCSSSGAIIGASYSGLLVGSQDTGTISNCSSSGTVIGSSSVGGLIGRFGGVISNSSSSASVFGSSSTIGGLVGWHDGTILGSYSIINGTVTGTSNVGALVGAAFSGSINNSYSIVEASAILNGTSNVGFVGSNSGTITNSYLTIRNITAGNITFLTWNVLGTGNILGNISIRNNFVYVNSLQTGLNKSANITLINLPTNFAGPRIYKDGVLCGSGCYAFTSLNAGNVTFNVSSWSNYTIQNNSLPVVSSVALTSTEPRTNDTNQNLTITSISASDAEGDNITLAYNWYKNNVLNATSLITNGLAAYYPLNNDTMDYAGSNDGTNNGASFTSSGKVGNAYNFDGSTSYINTGKQLDALGINESKPFTISLWFKPIILNKDDLALVGSNKPSLSNRQFGIYYYANGRIAVGFYQGPSNYYSVTSNSALTAGSWTHFVFTYNGSVGNNAGQNYVNGNLKSDIQNYVGAYTLSGVDNNVIIGAIQTSTDTAYSYYINGTLDEVQIYNRTLNASEIKQLYEGSRLGGNQLHSSNLIAGDIWKVGVVPYDYLSNGSEKLSNDIGINVTINITTYNYTNITGSTGGSVVRGQNLTINATVQGAVSQVWVVIWQNVVGGPILLMQNLINYLGNLWSVVIGTNYTFPSGTVNYTIYANNSANYTVSQNGTINITSTCPSWLMQIAEGCLLNYTYYATNNQIINLNNNLIIGSNGSIANSSGISFTVNLTGYNLTIQSGGNVNGNGLPDATAPKIGSSIIIITSTLNLSSGGLISSSGGNLSSSTSSYAGAGGTINITANTIYLDGNISVNGGNHLGGTNNGAGGNAGTLQINPSNNLIINGVITGIGGTGRTDYCYGSPPTGIRGTGGKFIYNSNYNLTVNNTFDFSASSIGACNGYNLVYVNSYLKAQNILFDTNATAQINGIINATNLLDVRGKLGFEGASAANAALTTPLNGGILNIFANNVSVSNTGIISVRGGNLSSGISMSGGAGGTLNITSNFFNLDGNLSANGGDAYISGGGNGGNAGIIQFNLNDSASINGVITGMGGNGLISSCNYAGVGGGRGNGGKLIYNNPNFNLTVNGTIDLGTGNIGACNAYFMSFINSIINVKNLLVDTNGRVQLNGIINATNLLDVRGKLGFEGAPAQTAFNYPLNGGTLNIFANNISVSNAGMMSVRGGNLTASIVMFGGVGGTLNITSNFFYLGGNISVNGGDHAGGTNAGSGGNAGILQINSNDSLLINGYVTSIGGTGCSNVCHGVNAGGWRGSGGNVILLGNNITISQTINQSKGSVGFCSSGVSGIYYIGGNLTVISQRILNISAITSQSADTNGTARLTYSDDLLLGGSSFTENPFITRNTSDGQVQFLQGTSNYAGINYSSGLKIFYNSVFVNSSAYLGLNKSANIILRNLPTNFTKPEIKKDGVKCLDCYNFTSLNAGNVTFNVSSWSNYSIGEEILNITSYNYTNITGVTAGTVIRGQNLTINATVTGATNVWVVIWQNVIGGPMVLIQNLINYLGNLWSAVIQTNYTFPSGIVNYTIYANASTNANVSMNGTINILGNRAYVYTCGTLNESNTVYTLQNNVTPIATFDPCFNITASNITLDGNGYNILGKTYLYQGLAPETSKGIYSNPFSHPDNVIIKNFGGINNFTYAISGFGDNWTIVNNSLKYNWYTAIDTFGGNIRIVNNSISDQVYLYGIACGSGDGASNNSIIENNTITNSPFGLQVDGSNHIIKHNTLNITTYSGIELYTGSGDIVTDNTFLGTGNYNVYIWSDSNNNNVSGNFTNAGLANVYVAGDGNRIGGNFTANVGIQMAGAGKTLYLLQNSSFMAIGINVTADSAVVDGSGYGISGVPVPGAIGIFSVGRNSVNAMNFKNISNFYHGAWLVTNNSVVKNNVFGYCEYVCAYFLSGNNNSLLNNYEYWSNNTGFDFSDESSTVIRNNTLLNNSANGILIWGTSHNVTADSNTINYGVEGINLRASNNTIINNTIANASSHGIWIYASNNNLLSGNNLTNNIEGITLSNGASNNTVIYNFLNSGIHGISLYSSATSNVLYNNQISLSSAFSIYQDYSTMLSNTAVYNNSFGEIRWVNNNLTTTNNLTFPGTINLGSNLAIYSPAGGISKDRLNSSANVTLRGLSYNGNYPLMLRKILKNGKECGSSCFNFTSLVPPPVNYCYQETANLTTSCGGLGTGTYSSAHTPGADWDGGVNLTYDGDWDTSSSVNAAPNEHANMTVTYNIPPNANIEGTLWQIKYGAGPTIENLSLNSSCLNINNFTLRVTSYANEGDIGTIWQCYNGSQWIILRSSSSGSGWNGLVYEEAIIWDTTLNYVKFQVSSWSNYSIGKYVRNKSEVELNSGWNLFSLTMENSDEATNRSIEVVQGWNLIGYSTGYAILNPAGVVVRNTTGEELFYNASNNGKLNAYFSYFDSRPGYKKYQYIAEEDEEQNFTTSRGYWVYSNQTQNLTFPSVGGSYLNETYRYSDLMFRNSTGTELNITDAFNQNWISDPYVNIYYYDPTLNLGKGDFWQVEPDYETISPWKGYFILGKADNITMLRQN